MAPGELREVYMVLYGAVYRHDGLRTRRVICGDLSKNFAA